MARNWTRRLVVAGVVPLTACAVLVANAVPAYANGSAAGIAQNAWLVSDLAAQAANTAQRMPYDPVLEAELTTAAAATTSTTAKPGVRAKPKASGKLGLIINTAVVLGGLAFEFGGGSDEVPLPMPPSTGSTTYPPGNQQSCGWASGWVTSVTCNTSLTPTRVVSNFSIARPGGWSGWWGVTLVPAGTLPVVGTPPPSSYSRCNGCTTWASAITRAQEATQKAYDVVLVQGFDNVEKVSGVIGSVLTAPIGGTVNGPSAPVTDPAVVPRYIESEITCKSSTGGSQVFSQTTGPFTITPGQPNMLPEAPQMTCPAGTWLDSGKRELSTQGTTERVPLQEPYVRPDWLPEQITANPNCWPAGATKCKLEVVRIGVQPEYDCNSIPVGSGGHPCRDWWSDPRRPERYDCRFGGVSLSLKRCEPYKRSFQITDGGPTLDRTPTDPDAPPAPPAPEGTDPTPDKTPDSDGCVPSWSSLLSPWWVFKAASCALAWAFVPPSGHLDDIFVGLRDDWNATTPGLWLAELSGMVNVPAGGCGGIPVDFNLGYGVNVDMDLGEACSGSMANAASIVKLAVTAIICVGGAFAGIRILGSGLGWAPGIGKGVDS